MMCSHAVIDSNVGQSVMLRAMRKVGQGGGEGVHESSLNPNGNHVVQNCIKVLHCLQEVQFLFQFQSEVGKNVVDVMDTEGRGRSRELRMD